MMAKESKKTTRVRVYYREKRELVEKLLKPDAIFNWAREMSIANKLFEMVDDVSFWNSFSLDFKLNSLAFLLTERGKDMVEHKQKIIKFEMPERKTYIMEDHKIGEDRAIPAKRKTLKEFIRDAHNGKTKD